jgi:hypothetical protein
MRFPLQVLLISISLFGQTPNVIDLDAPAVKKVTIKSEIERGRSTEFNCVLHLSHTNAIVSSKCPFNIIDENKQKNTDTDPFVLGVSLEAWVHTTIILKVIENLPDREQRGYSQGIGDAKLWFSTIKEKEKAIGIDDAILCKAVGMDYDRFKNDIEEWNKKLSTFSSISPSNNNKYRVGIKFVPGSDSLHVLVVDPSSPNTAILGKFIIAIDGERGTGLALQARLNTLIALHQDGSPLKVTVTNSPQGPEEEATLKLF